MKPVMRHPTTPTGKDERPHLGAHRQHQPSHSDIERRAYERYRERDGQDGSAMLDWLEAERELRLAASDRAFAPDEDR
jgi:outer membrane protein TolC